MQAVLLVEDDEVMELVLRPQFQQAGVALDYAADGYAAIDCIRVRVYDAIILDLVLGRGLSGFGVLNFLEMEQPGMMDRVFLTTGMSEQTVMRAAPELLPRLFRKPFDDKELVRTVLEFISHERMARRSSPFNVLIVDDDETSAVIVEHIVNAAGWKAAVVHDGRAAIQCIVAGGVDAIVLDLLMPGIDGFGVIEYLRAYDPSLLKRTVVVSGIPSAFRERLGGPDVCASLEKPLRPGALLEALVQCVRGGK
jgi:DNA-binding response OmpR family regulator